MLKAEKLKTVSSVKIRKYGSNSKRIMLRSRQKGSILIGIIITMVIMASLGAGMVYLTTTSTFQELFANNNARAYYAAESGGRYAMAMIRDAYSTNTTNLQTNLEKTYDIGNSTSFQITGMSFNGGNPETVSFTSIGTIGSGFMTAKRQIRYSISPANQSGKSNVTVYTTNQMVSDTSLIKGTFATVPTGQPYAGSVQVTGTTTDWNAQYYASAYFNPSGADFLGQRTAQGGFLSYDSQVKVLSEVDYFSAGLGFRLHDVSGRPRGFHLDFMRFSTYGPADGISAATGELKQWPGATWPSAPVMEVGATYIILWFDDVGGRSGWETLLAYKKLDENNSGVLPVPKFLDNMEIASPLYVGANRNGWTVDVSNPWVWTTNDHNSGTHSWNINLGRNIPMTTLMSKEIDASSISTTGELSFAYKVTSNTNASGTVQICTGPSATTCHTTAPVFTLSAGNTDVHTLDPNNFYGTGWFHVTIPITGFALTNTTVIKFIATTTNAAGAGLTWYVDDVKLAAASNMPSWSTLMVRLNETNVTNVTDTDKRRNVIKAYYSTIGNNPENTMIWPVTTGSDPNFTLVQWDQVKPHSADANIDDLADKTIVQTKWYRTTALATLPSDGTYWYNVTNDYAEVGLSLFSATSAADHVYFRDFALKMGSVGGLDGSGSVIQY